MKIISKTAMIKEDNDNACHEANNFCQPNSHSTTAMKRSSNDQCRVVSRVCFDGFIWMCFLEAWDVCLLESLSGIGGDCEFLGLGILLCDRMDEIIHSPSPLRFNISRLQAKALNKRGKITIDIQKIKLFVDTK